MTGLLPEFTDDHAEALTLLRRDGAVCIRNAGIEASDATGLGHRLFGDKVLTIPEAARVFEGGEKDQYVELDHRNPLRPHTDGFAYGDRYPDFISLNCVRSSPNGGESFLVDGYALLDQLHNDTETRWLAEALSSTPVDQTEENMQVSQSCIVQQSPSGRKMLRRNFSTKPLKTSQQPDQDQLMIDSWVRAVDAAGKSAPRFKLEPGDALVIDNYRVLHAREGYEDLNRMMWRVWIWTDECLGVPDMPLHSDSRFATADA